MDLATVPSRTALTLLGIFHTSDIGKVRCVGYPQPSHAVGVLPL